MMVSKVAVIALVAILAVPILLGYALNLEETTHNDYEISGDPLNVTKMLENDRYYESVRADQYTLNTSVSLFHGASEYHIVPIYQKSGTETTSYPFRTSYNQYWSAGDWTLDNKTITYLSFVHNTAISHVDVEVYSGGTLVDTISWATYVYYDKNTDTINYNQFNSSHTYIVSGQISGGNYTKLYVRLYGMNTVPVYWGVYDPSTSPQQHVDFSAGFRFTGGSTSLLDLPDYTNSFIVTINIDSMLNANDYLGINGSISSNTARITKITTNGEVQYYIEDNSGNRTYLYYDPNRSDNTYQMYYQLSYVGEINGTHHYNIHTEFRYIGGWPTYIGEAPYYLKYELDADRGAAPGVMGVQRVYLTNGGGSSSNSLSAIMRVDTANFTGFMYNSIHDNVYNPGEFRTNPATTITNIRHFGASLTFGGTTFIVKDGNITLGDHDFSVRKLVFDSIPVAGGYENRIDGVVISTTATPSTLTFGGHWKADVITDSMELKSYTSTEWTPGQFAWNGLDQNFLMIGLLAALGVFIALGIAYRKVKSALFALLVVCGGAAVLFFTMI